MKIESPAFTADDIRSFMASYRDHERHALANRMEEVSKRLLALGPRLASAPSVADGPPVAEGWSAHDVLAHIAVVSKFYGVLVHRIANGKVSEFDLLESVHMRDAAGQQMAELDDEQLIRVSVADQQRTVEALRGLDSEALRRSAHLDDAVTMSAEEVARLPLVAHLELHLEQLEERLA
jgi:uncharacterized damage-inducible protein DinB